MTVSTTSTRDQYTGTGANTALATTFAFNASSEIQVTSRVTATGVETVLSETTHYTVTGGAWSTGTVTPVDGATDFPSTVEWTIERITPITQATDYVANDAFPAESHEQALDKLTFITQEREDRLDRALVAPTTDDTALDMELPNSVDRASLFLAFDADGEPIASSGVTPATVTVSSFGETLIDDADADAARVTLDAQEDVITTQGDIVVGDSGGDASRLAVGAAGSVLQSDGTDPEWVAAADVALPRSYLAGLALTNDTDTDHDIAIAVGECRDSTNAENIVVAAALGKQIDVTWAAGGTPGTTAGGLNATDFAAGAPEASQLYHVFVIKHTDGTVDAGFDKDVDATNLLADSGYTYYRRIGSVITDSGNDLLQFTQVGDTFVWDDPALDIDIGDLDETPQTLAVNAPPNCWALANAVLDDDLGDTGAPNATHGYVYSTYQDDEVPHDVNAPLLTLTEGHKPVQIWIYTDASSSIDLVSDDPGGVGETTGFNLSLLMYVDTRGRDG